MESGKENDRNKLLMALEIRNDCSAAKRCGGCSYSGRSYFEQTAAKEKRVKRLISPFCEVLPVHHCEEPLYYRNKLKVPETSDGYLSGLPMQQVKSW